jgi:hypothetical protein
VTTRTTTFAAALSLLLGCGPDVHKDCLDACAGCPGDGAACTEGCDVAAEAAEQSGCEDETSAYYVCFQESGVCTQEALETCAAENNAVLVCISEYCAENPDEDCPAE